ncbi:hypothetical protein BGZ97_001893 [Linnemannia gamsii]|uniref:Lytic polysaccharide monooxygenase n=1 Tax=Linnemannia gamsii TaxID=64522 RepID=A0A9P6RQK3_9FUNG|nr:hypothetical protein BGZ97_001893 [Linnemannia gamsii]
MLRKSTLITAAIQLVALVAHAHVDLTTPCSRYQATPGCPPPPAGQVIDYNTNAPISSGGINHEPLCKHSVPYAQRTVYKAGESIPTGYGIGSAHGGGHCQWALSYDHEKTWVVIQTEIRTCLQGAVTGQTNVRVPVVIPKDAPSGNATFMWLWVNAIGVRELYSNCADIRIEGQDGGTVTGVEPLLANYNTTYGIIPEFPTAADPDSHELFNTRKPISITVGSSGGTATLRNSVFQQMVNFLGRSAKSTGEEYRQPLQFRSTYNVWVRAHLLNRHCNILEKSEMLQFVPEFLVKSSSNCSSIFIA